MRISFLVASGCAGLVWLGGSRLAGLAAQIPNSGLRDAVHFLLALVDPVWFALAAATVYLATARIHGLSTARRWAVIVLGGVSLLLAVNGWSAWPLGSILFTRQLGIRLAGVPVALPFLWFAILLGGRDLLARLLPRVSHAQLALGTGLLVALTEFFLEPLAQYERAFWFWSDPQTHAPTAPPLQNFLAWFLASSTLAFTLREPILRNPTPPHLAPRRVFAIFQGVFLATLLRRLILG